MCYSLLTAGKLEVYTGIECVQVNKRVCKVWITVLG